MRRATAGFLLVFILVCCAWAVNGELVELDGIKVLRVWGTPYERGFAHGFLMAEEIYDVASNYMLPYAGAEGLAMGRLFAALFFGIPDRFIEELQGIIDGVRAAGVSLYIDELGREADVLDLVVANSIADLSSFMCSSVSAWGDATQNSELGGNLAIVRNLDWGGSPWADDGMALVKHSMVLVEIPESDEYQPFVSITFPGFIGCLSCFNEAGVGAFQNQGDYDPHLEDISGTKEYLPINLAIREGIEARDYDGDSVQTVLDVLEAIEDNKRVGSYLIHVVQPYGGKDAADPAIVVESHLAGAVVRYAFDDPDLGDYVLAVTNGHRKMFPPRYCWRYELVVEMVQDYDYELDEERLWDIGEAISYDGRPYSFTYQTMIYIPHERTIGLAITDEESLSSHKEPVMLTWDELLTGAGDDDDDTDDDAGDDDSTDDDSAADDDSTGQDDTPSSSAACGC